MPNKAKHIYKLARLELGRFIRLATGHNNLNQFQSRIGLWHTASCRLCGEQDETYFHFATECPRLWHTRRELFGNSPPCADMQWSTRDLLNLSYVPVVNEAFEGTWAHSDPPLPYDPDSTTHTHTIRIPRITRRDQRKIRAVSETYKVRIHTPP